MMMCSWSPDSMIDSLMLGSTENLPSSMMSGLLRRTCSRQNQDHHERSHCTVRSGGPEAGRLSSPPIHDGAKDRAPELGCSPPHRALPILWWAAQGDPHVQVFQSGLGHLTIPGRLWLL